MVRHIPLRLLTLSAAGLVSFALAAAEPDHEPPARPDPSAPRSFAADQPAPEVDTDPVPPAPTPAPPNPGDAQRTPGAGPTPTPGFGPAPRHPALGEDGIRDPGEDTSPPRPRPGVMPEPGSQRPPVGDDGIRDANDGQAPRPRPGVMPEPAPAHQDGDIQPEPGAQPRAGTSVIPRDPATGTGGVDAVRDSNPSPGPGTSDAE